MLKNSTLPLLLAAIFLGMTLGSTGSTPRNDGTEAACCCMEHECASSGCCSEPEPSQPSPCNCEHANVKFLAFTLANEAPRYMARVLVTNRPAFAPIAGPGIELAGIVVDRKQSQRDDRGAKATLRSALPHGVWDWLIRLRRWAKAEPRERGIIAVERVLAREASRLFRFEIGPLANQDWPRGVEIAFAPDVNGPDSVEFVRRCEPDLLALYQPSILGGELLGLAPGGALNAHPAILPDYRGALVEFWQAYNSDYDKAGVTIHYATERVDSGDIVYQWHYDREDSPDPFTLAARNALHVVEAFPRVIAETLAGTTSPAPQPGGGRAYRAKDFTLDIREQLCQRFHRGSRKSQPWPRATKEI